MQQKAKVKGKGAEMQMPRAEVGTVLRGLPVYASTVGKFDCALPLASSLGLATACFCHSSHARR